MRTPVASLLLLPRSEGPGTPGALAHSGRLQQPPDAHRGPGDLDAGARGGAAPRLAALCARSCCTCWMRTQRRPRPRQLLHRASCPPPPDCSQLTDLWLNDNQIEDLDAVEAALQPQRQSLTCLYLHVRRTRRLAAGQGTCPAGGCSGRQPCSPTPHRTPALAPRAGQPLRRRQGLPPAHAPPVPQAGAAGRHARGVSHPPPPPASGRGAVAQLGGAWPWPCVWPKVFLILLTENLCKRSSRRSCGVGEL